MRVIPPFFPVNQLPTRHCEETDCWGSMRQCPVQIEIA